MIINTIKKHSTTVTPHLAVIKYLTELSITPILNALASAVNSAVH